MGRFLREIEVQAQIEDEVMGSNITIIEGIGASQYGIGIVSARLAEAVLQDEGCVAPAGRDQEEYGAMLSPRSVIGRGGVVRTLEPKMFGEEREGLERSAQALPEALAGARG